MSRVIARGAALLAAALSSAPALAAYDCFIDAVATAAFGIYDGTQNDGAVTTISGRCTNSPPPGFSPIIDPVISLSTGGSGSYATRQMANGAQRLNYNLYSNAARTTVWGNGGAGTVTVRAYAAPVVLFGNQSRAFNAPLTIYGRAPAGQTASNGSYSDTITLTIEF